MAVIYTPHFVQFFDDNGEPLAGGKLYTYAAGTTDPKETFTTAAGDISNTNPVVLDSAGRATLFLTGSYKFTLTDADDVLIRTTDNITAFSAIGESSEAYFESFSGDGSETTFTLSEDLGSDEKTIMVFVDDGLQEHITNGEFATDTGWTKGTGWTIGSGVATATGGISTAIEQNSAVSLIEGKSYNLTFTVTRSAGSLTPSLGGEDGEAVSASGTYSQTIIAGSTQVIAFTGSGFTGTLDNVKVAPSVGSGFNILPPTSYTLSGTSLVFANSPAKGTGNIQVWAPSTLVNAAAASADAADTSATNAEISAQSASDDAAQTALDRIQTGLDRTAAESAKDDAEDARDEAIVAAASASVGNLNDLTEGTAETTDYIAFVDRDDSNLAKKAELGNIVGSAAFSDTGDFATAAQGAKADSAFQSSDIGSQAEIAAETSEKLIDGANAKYHPAATKAWVNFNGTGTVAIRDSYNVSSITDNGTGNYTVNFTNSFASANRAVIASCGRNATGSGGLFVAVDNNTALSSSSVELLTLATSGSTVDTPNVFASVCGDLA